MPNKNNRVILAGVADHFKVNFRDQRARRINHLKFSFAGPFADLWWDAVGTEYNQRALRDVIERIDENRTLFSKFIDHMTVMDYFLVHIYGTTKLLDRQANDFNGADDTCTKASGTKKQERTVFR